MIIDLMELEGVDLDLQDMEEHSFQSISLVETDPSQQSILPLEQQGIFNTRTSGNR
jgi:hypothetical protein